MSTTISKYIADGGRVCCLVRTCYWQCNLIVPVSRRGRPSLLLSQQINQIFTYMCNIELFGIFWR